MNKKFLFAFSIITLLICSDVAFGQKYWVKFKNKKGTPYSIGNPSAYLSVKSIVRRATHGIGIDSTDLPVTPSYVSQVDAVPGVTVLYRSKWINGIAISVTNTVALSTINTFTFVQTTAAVERYKVTIPEIEKNYIDKNAQSQKTANPLAYNYGNSFNQATMIGADCMHNAGFRGQGITIAVLDAGFLNVHIDNIFDSLFMQNRLIGTRDFVTGDTMVFEDHSHGAMCLSTMAGIGTGSNTIIGTAPKANYWLLRTEDVGSETPSEEYNWIRGIEFADSVGADISTTSLGYTTFDNSSQSHTYSQLNGKTSPMSIASTMASRKGIIVLSAAGNEGGSSWNFISVPADADSIITVGAVDGSYNKAGFSSFGPTSDGRIKPDLCSQGAAAWVCNTGCFPGNGTSFATPILAGGVACLLQSKPFANPMQIINALKASATNSAVPNNNIGWGVPKLCAAKAGTLLTVSGDIKVYESNVQVYPNPFNNTLNISFNGIASTNADFVITDIIGKVVFTSKITNTSQTNSFSEFESLKPGVYFINISTGQSSSIMKIVKQ